MCVGAFSALEVSWAFFLHVFCSYWNANTSTQCTLVESKVTGGSGDTRLKVFHVSCDADFCQLGDFTLPLVCAEDHWSAGPSQSSSSHCCTRHVITSFHQTDGDSNITITCHDASFYFLGFMP